MHLQNNIRVKHPKLLSRDWLAKYKGAYLLCQEKCQLSLTFLALKRGPFSTALKVWYYNVVVKSNLIVSCVIWGFYQEMVFCFENCSHLLWEKNCCIDQEKKLEAENLQKVIQIVQWKVSTMFLRLKIIFRDLQEKLENVFF